jgi:hypothetical protein
MPELGSQQRQPLLRNDFADMPVARQWLSSRHVVAVKDKQVTIELLETVFSVRSVPRLFNEDQVPWGLR